MKGFFVLLSLLSLLKVQSVPVICIDASLPLVINTECSDLRVYKLNENLCSYDFQNIDIDLQEDTKKFWFLYFQNSQGIPISQFSKSQLQIFPNIQKIIVQFCPFEEISADKKEFLRLGSSFSGLDEVIIGVYNASGMSGNKGVYQNFYQYAPMITQVPFESRISLTMKDLNQALQVFNDEANYTVFSMKLYSQYATVFPRDALKIESKLALENPKKHTIDMVSYLIYDVLNTEVPVDQQEKIYHELNEICLKNDGDNKTFHLIVDRIANGAEKLKFWNSRINIDYIGEGDGCDLNSDKWADAKSGICEQLGQPCLIARAEKTNLNYSMQKVIDLTLDFLTQYRKFNSVFNCQHFGTNFYNKFAEDTLDFENWEIMTVHSPFCGLKPAVSFVDYPI